VPAQTAVADRAITNGSGRADFEILSAKSRVCVCVCVCVSYQNEEKPFIGDPLTGSLARAVSLSFFLSIKGHSLNIRRAAFAEPGSGRVARN
jgi:hypothetical protein